MAVKEFDFLESYIEALLDKVGFERLTEETRAQYVPQFVAEAERRLALAVLPKLSKDGAERLTALLRDEKTTPDVLQRFWQEEINGFQDIVKATLEDFAKEVQQVALSLR